MTTMEARITALEKLVVTIAESANNVAIALDRAMQLIDRLLTVKDANPLESKPLIPIVDRVSSQPLQQTITLSSKIPKTSAQRTAEWRRRRLNHCTRANCDECPGDACGAASDAKYNESDTTKQEKVTTSDAGDAESPGVVGVGLDKSLVKNQAIQATTISKETGDSDKQPSVTVTATIANSASQILNNATLAESLIGVGIKSSQDLLRFAAELKTTPTIVAAAVAYTLPRFERATNVSTNPVARLRGIISKNMVSQQEIAKMREKIAPVRRVMPIQPSATEQAYAVRIQR